MTNHTHMQKANTLLKRLLAKSVFPINDSARVQLYVIMPVRPQRRNDINHR
jgi:hypothetical protein